MPAQVNLGIKKAVIPAGGMGSRLLPITKEIPKEMLPIPVVKDATILLKPILQAVFEELYSRGLREFCIITGRGKRSIEDHFTPDQSLIRKLGNSVWKTDLEGFFRKIQTSRIYFVNQSVRRGFGDAVLHAEEFVGGEPFLVHAGDDFVLPGRRNLLGLLSKTFRRFEADAVMLAEVVEDPSHFGVIVGDQVQKGLFRVKRLVEKPKKPPSKLAVIAVYAFSSRIFDAIRMVSPDDSGEIQLTAAIGQLIDQGRRVFAMSLGSNERRIEIGTPESYLRSVMGLARNFDVVTND